MKHSEFRELVSLADALTFVSESELFGSLVKNYSDDTMSLHDWLRTSLALIADSIKENLIA